MSSSTNSESEQYEGGGGSVGSFEGGRADHSCIAAAQEMYTVIQETRNYENPYEYDFTDPETGQVREYFNSMTNQEKLDQIKEVIRRLRAYKARVDAENELPQDDTYKEATPFDQISDDAVLEDEPAGDEYIIWEPRELLQKIKNFLWNMMEANVFMALAIVCYSHPSFNALQYFWVYLTILWPMTKDIKKRYKWNVVILVLLLLFECVKVFYKRKMSNIVDATKNTEFPTRQEYYEKTKQMLNLGFSFHYNQDIIHPGGWVNVQAPYIIHGYNWFQSYDVEITAAILNIFLIIFSIIQDRKIAHLQTIKKGKFLDFIRLLYPVEEEQVEEMLAAELSLGTSKKAFQMKKDQQREKEKKREEDRLELNQLHKEIKVNLIGSEKFYNCNRIFFVMGLLTSLFESVTFNSFSCIPGLFLVLILFACYDLRKKYSRFYRSYSFVVIYWIRFIMIVKVSIEIYTAIPYVNMHLHHEKEDILAAQARGEAKGAHQWESTFFQVWFGEIFHIDVKENDMTVALRFFYQFMAFFLCLYGSQGWITCKWLEIRDKTPFIQSSYSSFHRFWAYIKVRENEDNEENRLVQLIAENKDKKKIQQALNEAEQKQKMMKGKYDSGNAKKKAQAHNSYLGAIVLFCAQIAMFLLAYGYHGTAGFFHLCWLVLSFILSTKNTLFLSVVVMIPMLTWEFTFIYMSKVHKIRDTEFFKLFGKYYRFDMINPTLEQFFMLVTLLLFYMMISSYLKAIDNKPAENGFIRFFRIRIHAKKVLWIWVFFFCRYVHLVILVYLFYRGVSDLDCFNNLGYMIFFVVYTAYESIYRKTGGILIFFTASFVVLQYFFSLHYQVYMKKGNEEQIDSLYWWNVFPNIYKNDDNLLEDPFHIKTGETLYFRSSPHIEDWINIFMMRFLREVNIIYTKEKVTEYRLRQEAKHILEEKSGKLGYYWARVQRIIVGLFNYFVIVALVAVQALTQPSVITWFFFALNLINLGYMIKGTRVSRELKIQYNISSTIRFFSLIVIIANILILASGHRIDNENSKIMVSLKRWLQIIGLKANQIDFIDYENGGKVLTQRQKNIIEHHALRGRMIAMVIFFLLSIYLCNHFSSMIKVAKEDENFDEADYKKLFEYKIKKKQDKEDNLESGSESDKINDVDQLQESVFKKRRYYTQVDLIEFYEGVRFTIPFMTYRALRFWNKIDIIAKFANIFVTGIYIYVTFYQEVNFFSLVNLFLLGQYFFNVTRNVGKLSEKIQKATGLQGQSDVQMARLITKRYKKEASYQFLEARKTAWRRLFATLMILSLLAYPTPILLKVREMGLTERQLVSLDKFNLFLFYMGVQYDKSDELTVGLLLLGLTIERIAINWLDSRFGCTHFKLQKFVELDQRREAIRYDWDVPNPVYDINEYKKHYFRNDFDEIKTLISHKTFTDVKTKLSASSQKEMHFIETLHGDFIPLKIGQRIVDTVKFTVQLNCQAKLLSLDEQTKKFLAMKEYDYESVPVLQKFKIESLWKILKENIDRKYKISYYKGLQLFYESVIIFLLMISLVMKANFWSIVYLIFVFKYTCTRNKTKLLVRITSYLSWSLFIQYTLFLLNLTAGSSPQPFPKIGKPTLRNYPFGFMTGNMPDFPVPIFFHFAAFRDNLMLSYMLGVGIDTQQVYSLTFDFVNIFLMTMYIYEFRNPVLNKTMKKVFWQFPTQDDREQWARLDKDVQKQVEWIYNPKPLYRESGDVHPLFREIHSELSKDQIQLADDQVKFAQEYNRENEYDLNYALTSFVDLKYQAIWGEELIKEKKGEIKANCMYYRLVKQGSQMIYISFHIITIFIVLLMAAMRQSVFGILYVVILLPRMKDGAEVLKQRDIQQGKELEDLQHQIDDEKEVLKQKDVKKTIIDIVRQKLGLSDDVNMDKQYSTEMKQLANFLLMNTDELDDIDRHIMIDLDKNLKQYQDYTSQLLLAPEIEQKECEVLMLNLVKKYRKLSGEQIQEHKDKLAELQKRRYVLEKTFQKKNAQLKKSDRDKIASQQWKMIGIVQRWLLGYALFDVTCQILFQMPVLILPDMKKLRHLGLRKVWSYSHGPGYEHLDLGDLTYKEYIRCDPLTQFCPQFELDWRAFYFQVMICFIVSQIMLQSEIFESSGYLKYVTQQNGSLDLLIQMAKLKAKSVTYASNNQKIRKILSIQRKREVIMKTVDKLKDKIYRWRQFTRTTLINKKGPSQFEEELEMEKQRTMLKQQSQLQETDPVQENTKDDRQNEVEQILENKKAEDVSSGGSEGQHDPSYFDKEEKPVEKKKSPKEKTPVTFAQEDEDGDQEEEEDDEEDDEILKAHKQKMKIRISPEEREQLLSKLSRDFVKAKLGKQRTCVKCYLCLQNCFVEKIMFKNEINELELLKTSLAQGSLEVPTELQQIMIIESNEVINAHYDNLEGQDSLFKLMKMNRDKGASLLSLTKFDNKIKLNQLKMTWEYTRTIPMLLHFIETFFYILMSQTQSILYFGMVFSMYENAGIISLPYPIAVFGWAMLEEKRPGKKFWRFIRIYTEFVLFFKFIFNLDIFSGALNSPNFIEINQTFKFGIYDFRSLSELVLYELPEILILCFLMLHEIKLQLMGLDDEDEETIEPVLDGIQRNILKGDEDAVQAKKVESQNMCMERYFESPSEQNQRMDEFIFLEKDNIRRDLNGTNPLDIFKNENYKHIIKGNYSTSQVKSDECMDKLVEFEYEQKYPADNTLLEKHNHLIKDIAKSIDKTSRKFDIDKTGATTVNDAYVRDGVIQKTLEKDSLIYVEGHRPWKQPIFMTRHEFKVEHAKPENFENFSAGDYKEGFKHQFDILDNRELNQDGWFEKSAYFDRIFPSLKIQKPGYDLYGTTTFILGLMVGYIFIYFEEYSFTQNFFDFAKGQTVVFAGEMAMTIILVLVVMMIERYANRTNTKKVEEKKLQGEGDEQKKSFFSNDEMFKRTTTQRSMTVKLKTVKTSDLDMSSGAAQDFLHSFDNMEDQESMDDSRTKITPQQKTKYFLHWFMLIFGHFYCFWFIPIRGNFSLYGTASCDESQKDLYRCYNFKENGYLRGLYIMQVLYLVVSSYQISLGFPLLKKASSVMQYYEWFPEIGAIIGNVYLQLPFIAELRCLLDFTFSKTSLDIFQFFQLFNYHMEMYLYWIGNRWYVIKDLGMQIEPVEKCIFGVLIASIVLFLVVGPFIIFSDFSPLVSYNEVLDGQINLAFQINKTIGIIPETGTVEENVDNLNATYTKLTSSLPYPFYHLENPYLKALDNETWTHNEFSKKTETRDFKANQAQFCVLRRHSDRGSQLSNMANNDLRRDILEKKHHPQDLNFSLQFDYSFTRAFPMTALKAYMKQNRSIENNFYNDCKFMHEIAEIGHFECGKIRDKSLSTSAILTQAYNPALVLGQNNWITEVNEKQKDPKDLLHDIRITFYCDNTWDITGSLHTTSYAQGGDQDVHPHYAREVEPHTCKLKHPDELLDAESEAFKKKYDMTNEEYFEYERTEAHWSNIILLLFSMKVATGFIAQYTPTTFYAVLVYGLFATVRIIFVFGTWAGYTYENTSPEPMMKLCEACYIMRFEENLVGEEECYRMLVEIIRQPQLYKELGGTSLTGTMHPSLDHLTPEQRKKLVQLDKMERKGWDVGPLKQKIISGDRKIDTDDAF